MRLDEYLHQHEILAIPVEKFDGFEVEVEGPQDWEAVESQPGMRIWIWPDDPCRPQFCANAVLTMHRVPARIDSDEVFEMLCDEQVQLVPRCHERYRASQPADNGMGINGMLSSQFDSEFGAIASASQTRIIPLAQETLIAQLTLTALLESPANWADVRLVVTPTGSAANTAEVVAARTTGGGPNAGSATGPTANEMLGHR